ncbi:MAG: carbamoyltransferase C-terminal domain-containing protein [Rhodospirillales bacterium]
MIILGISDNHESHACVVRDGVLVAAIAEERLSRLKADSRFPARAIKKVLAIAGVDPREVDLVVFAGNSSLIWQTLYNKAAVFSVQDWLKEMDFYWKPRLLEGKFVSPFKLYDEFRHLGGDDIESDPYFPSVERMRNSEPEDWCAIGDEIRRDVIEQLLGIPGERVITYRHEDCHKAYGFYSSPYPRDDALVMTIEGGGDDSSATISTMDKAGTITEYWKSNRVQVGRLYAYVTLLLGMKPGQHEYKLMGLAPYGTEYHGRDSLAFFRQINRVAGTEIHNDEVVADLYFSVREALRAQRFDGIAWGIQEWVEEILTEWVTNNITAHGCSNVILSGGVAQNIKACKRLAEIEQLDKLWVGPISGDGSLAIGAAWLAARDRDAEHPITGMPDVYLGSSYDKSTVEAAITRAGLDDSFTVHESPIAADAAAWLDDGRVIARYSGRMEFGQRALGNRSILADPRQAETVERINRKIKYRDFWMPFTPSMTIEQADEMLVNPKGLYSPFMTMAFDLQREYVNSIPAAMHPADKTVRPQMLRRENNPGYYDLMTAFKERSGIACVMNTSFNLHGEAIVETPEDAISTFLRSDLDVLLFDDVAISRIGTDGADS